MPALECATPEEAVDRALQAEGCATAICWRGSSAFDVHLGATTAFGPTTRAWRGATRAFLDGLVADTVRAAAGPVFVSVGGDPAGAMARLAGSGVKVPYKEVDGVRTSTWWTSAEVRAVLSPWARC